MKNRSFSCLSLLSFSAVLLLGACTSTAIKQRGYIEPMVFEETVTEQTDAAVLRKKLSRGLYQDGVDITVTPQPEKTLEASIRLDAFRQKWDEEKTRKALSTPAMQLIRKSSCFDVVLDANATASANLQYYTFYLFQDGKPKVELKPIAKSGAPEKSSHVGSYSTGGYGYQSGDTYYYTPTTTHVYSYDRYTSANIFCAGKKMDLKAGFMVVAEPRYKPGVPLIDFVWYTEKAQASRYKPKNSDDPVQSRINGSFNWEKARQNELRQLIGS